MTESEDLKLQLIELCGTLEAAQAAFAWVVETAPVTPMPAPVEGGVGLFDFEVLMLGGDDLKDLAMRRLAEKQNSPVSTKEVQAVEK